MSFNVIAHLEGLVNKAHLFRDFFPSLSYNHPSINLLKKNIVITIMQKAQEVLAKASGGKLGHKLPTRKLGRHGPEVTALGFGTMGLVR